MLPRLFGERCIDVVYWTLAYEFLFYVLAACFLLSRSDRVEFACLGWLLVSVLAMAYAPSSIIKVIGAPYTYLFVVGIMVYRLKQNIQNFTAWGVLATAILVAGRIPFGPNEHISGLANAVAVCAFATVLWFGTSIRPPRIFVYLGEISYGVYLINATVGLAVLNVGRYVGAPADLSIAVALLVVVGLAGIINAKIERPAQRWVKNMYARGRPFSVSSKQLAFNTHR
jgi:peptidoglycan/LPS O-acetylase OafA/YrhL